MIPEPIPESELNAVITLINSALPFESCVFPQIGERITIDRGPLAGAEGVLIDVRCTDRRQRFPAARCLHYPPSTFRVSGDRPRRLTHRTQRYSEFMQLNTKLALEVFLGRCDFLRLSVRLF